MGMSHYDMGKVINYDGAYSCDGAQQIDGKALERLDFPSELIKRCHNQARKACPTEASLALQAIINYDGAYHCGAYRAY